MARKKPARTKRELAQEDRQHHIKVQATILAYAERVRFIESDPGLYPCWGDLSAQETRPPRQGDDMDEKDWICNKCGNENKGEEHCTTRTCDQAPPWRRVNWKCERCKHQNTPSQDTCPTVSCYMKAPWILRRWP